MTDDGKPGVAAALDEALMETHHLANLSGLDEARQARRRLVEAQSASSVARTRDRLDQAIEYLELARMERRDTAAGFVQARELVAYAEAGLQTERPVPLTSSPTELVRSAPEREPRRTLEELLAEARVNSFDQLRYDVALDATFDQLRREVADDPERPDPADRGDLDPEAALELASLEMDIERSLQGPADDSAFEFVDDDELAETAGGRAGEGADEEAAAASGPEAESGTGDADGATGEAPSRDPDTVARPDGG